MSALGSIECTKDFCNTRRNIFGKQHILSQPAWILGAISLSLWPCHLSHPSESKETSLHLLWRNAASMCTGDQFSTILDWCSIRWTLAGPGPWCLSVMKTPSPNRTYFAPENIPSKGFRSSSNLQLSEGIFLCLRGCDICYFCWPTGIVRSALKTPSTHPCKIFGRFAATFR